MELICAVGPIDPHVHLRGEEYRDFEFFNEGLADAKFVGLQAILEQPNPVPQLTSEEAINNRLAQGEKHKEGLYHGIHIGLTNDEEQVRYAFRAASERKAGPNSVKVFWVHSTENMGILDPDSQKRIWEISAKEEYGGVIVQHLEAEDKFTANFDPKDPTTHSLRQNPEAELVQVQRQFGNAYDAGFKGTFYVAHVSNPDTIDFLRSEEEHKLPFKVAIEMTPHHALLNWDDYKIHGNRVKMNPPLRSPKMQEQLLERLLSGKVDVIGTDHAPHPLGKKDDPENPASGIPGIPFWPKMIQILRKKGLKHEQIRDLTFDNANKIFDLGLTPQAVMIGYYPKRWERYGFNPFSRVDGTNQ